MDHRGLPKARRGHRDAEVQEPGQTCGRGLQPKAKVPHLRVTRWDDRGSAAGMAPPRRPLHPLYFHREREPARGLPAAQTAARNGSSQWSVIEAERVAGPRGGPKEDPLLPLRDRSTSRRCSVGLDGRKPEGPRGGRPSASDPSSPPPRTARIHRTKNPPTTDAADIPGMGSASRTPRTAPPWVRTRASSRSDLVKKPAEPTQDDRGPSGAICGWDPENEGPVQEESKRS